jgi:hypothetical protein
MNRLIPWLALSLTGAPACAQPAPDDFAYGYRIETPQAGAVYELVLPEPLYSGVVRADLGDIAVFNAAGEPVPHALRGATQAPPAPPDPQSLPLYPLYENEQEIPRQLAVKLRADLRDAVVELDTAPRPETDGSAVAYIVDTRAVEEPIERLEVDWISPTENRIAGVSVQSSDDLAHWRTLSARTALARLDYAGNRLSQNLIDIHGRQGKYLKLSWLNEADGAQIIALRAQFAPRDGAPARQRSLFGGTRADTRSGPAFEYKLPGYLPVETVNLELEQVNSLLEATVYSRADPEQSWRRRCGGLFYRLQFPQAELKNPDIGVAKTSDRYWRVEYDPQASSPGAEIPTLEVGWRARRLVFLARGEGPFSLYYGSARVQARQAPVNSLIENLRHAADTLPLQPAQPGRPVAGNPDALSPPPAPLPWRTWLLWGSLIIGVLVLGGMAWRLYRQM